MAEIKVSYADLQEQNVDLEKLLSSSDLGGKLNACYLVTSRGKFVRASDEKCTGKTLELTKAFQRLVKNTMTFLNSVGIVFEDADKNASCRVDVITDKFQSMEGQYRGKL